MIAEACSLQQASWYFRAQICHHRAVRPTLNKGFFTIGGPLSADSLGWSPDILGLSPESCPASPDKRGPSMPPCLVFSSFGGSRRGEKRPMSAAIFEVGDNTEEDEFRCSKSDDSPKGGSPGGEKGRGGRPSE